MFKYSPFHTAEPKKQENKIMAISIKQHRKKLGLTQKALAAKLGVSCPITPSDTGVVVLGDSALT